MNFPKKAFLTDSDFRKTYTYRHFCFDGFPGVMKRGNQFFCHCNTLGKKLVKKKYLCLVVFIIISEESHCFFLFVKIKTKIESNYVRSFWLFVSLDAMTRQFLSMSRIKSLYIFFFFLKNSCTLCTANINYLLISWYKFVVVFFFIVRFINFYCLFSFQETVIFKEILKEGLFWINFKSM